MAVPDADAVVAAVFLVVVVVCAAGGEEAAHSDLRWWLPRIWAVDVMTDAVVVQVGWHPGARQDSANQRRV